MDTVIVLFTRDLRVHDNPALRAAARDADHIVPAFVLKARRFDPEGEYVRRYLPELEGVQGRTVHRPWKLGADRHRGLDYPEPIIDT